jgi:acid phosphatase
MRVMFPNTLPRPHEPRYAGCRFRGAAGLAVVLLALGVAASCSGRRAAAQPVSAMAVAPAKAAPDGLARIQTIVVIYAENRSFDNLYGLFPGANGITGATFAPQSDDNGTALQQLPRVQPTGKHPHVYPTNLPNRPFRMDQPPINLSLEQPTRDLVHRFYNHQEQINDGKNDRFARISDAGGLVMGYYDGSKLPMWGWAHDYTLADNFFQGAFGGSFLNHQWLICACTPKFEGADEKMHSVVDASGRRLARSPGPTPSALDGPPKFIRDAALTPDDYAVNTVQPPYQPSNVRPEPGGDPRRANCNPADATRRPLPPQTNDTIGDALSRKGVDWAWYAGAWNAALADGMQDPNAERKVIGNDAKGSPNFQAHHQPFNYFASFAPGTENRARHLKDYQEFDDAITAGTLPPVTFYKPQGTLNEHADYAEVLAGDEHIAGVVDKLVRRSPQWPGMAIIVTYDEFGGWWDHVAPPAGDRWGPGTRIPAIIISPFARRQHVDHTQYDTTSILKLITTRFDLEPLPGVRKSAGDLTAAFDFSQ